MKTELLAKSISETIHKNILTFSEHQLNVMCVCVPNDALLDADTTAEVVCEMICEGTDFEFTIERMLNETTILCFKSSILEAIRWQYIISTRSSIKTIYH